MTDDEARRTFVAYNRRCTASWLQGIAHSARWFRGVSTFNPATVEKPVLEPTARELEAFYHLA